MRSYKPHPHQRLMIDFMLANERCAIWCFMGGGKSSAVLYVVDIFLIAGLARKPLVLAPLRVARGTWPDEAHKWAEFAHLRIGFIEEWTPEENAFLKVWHAYQKTVRVDKPSKALEQEMRRLQPAAARSRLAWADGFDIVTCNYDVLLQLVDILGDRWPFDMVVADESTRLKSFRIKQGGKRTQALSRVAHTHVKRWINLTGTPAPNGLIDLWGQTWFLDGGFRLGRSFSDFQDRWFGYQRASDAVNAHKNHVQRIAFPHAQNEIQGELKDICLTLDPKDWFDLDEPIVRTVEIDLPPKARKHYREMEKLMFTEIEGFEIEAFAAAAKTIKCIAEGTEVLTLNGWKPIEHVGVEDFLWDGLDWVSCCGSVSQGYMNVVECRGVLMTPDHMVLTTEGWREAQEIADADARGRPHRTDVRLPDDHPPRRTLRAQSLPTGDMAGEMHLRKRTRCHRGEHTEPEPGGKKVVRMPPRGDAAGCLGDSRHDGPPGVAHLAQHEISLLEPERQGLAKLRCSWHKCLQALAAVVRRFLGRYGAYVGPRADARPPKEQSGLHPQELPLGYRTRTVQQPSGECCHPHAGWAHDSCPSIAAIRHQGNHDTQAHRARVGREGLVETRQVFDVLNAGPRHRFTVRNAEGTAIVVHNCLQMANGAAYVGESNEQWVEMHDEKLEALGSVVEEAAGAPVLVAYHFVSDLARLRKRFPRGRVLDTDPRTVHEWNAGQIPLLFAHPASAGHGLNLQDGGNILVYFGHWWNLEERQQILERIGPMRQKQAGHERPVFVYNIVARDTVDEVVIARLESKRSVQDELLAYMKRKS